MRILIFSDPHLGKKIYGYSIIEDQKKFLHWLLDIILDKSIDVLLICGDIFDSHIPSTDVYNIYYKFLDDIATTNTRTIIITGNHDPARRLTATKGFLKRSNIHIIGGIYDSIKEYVVNLEINGERASFAAVPYIEEGDALRCVSLEEDIERNLRYREAIKRIYNSCMSIMDSDNIRILMGHIFVQGGIFSDTERQQIGNAQTVRIDDFPTGADFIVMGHLHKSQTIPGKCPIIYPGSPMPLSFKEAEYDKKVYLVDIEKSGKHKAEEIIVPVFRELVRVEGTLDYVLKSAKSENWKDKYIEVKVLLDIPRIGIADEIRKAFNDNGGMVLIVGHVLSNLSKRDPVSINEIKTKSPVDIFCDYYKNKCGGIDPNIDTLNTFKDLLDMCKTQENEI